MMTKGEGDPGLLGARAAVAVDDVKDGALFHDP